MLFGTRSGNVAWLVVGLGNPGEQYRNTRHNMGFLTLDLLAEREKVKINRIRFHAVTADMTFGGERVLLMKPQTYMNLSGEAVREAAQFYKIPADHVLVIYDDVSLPVGKLRIRPSGSAGGHNGIKNIIAHLGTDVFPRIKIGIGAPDGTDRDMIRSAAQESRRNAFILPRYREKDKADKKGWKFSEIRKWCREKGPFCQNLNEFP